jgi:hypothetical protein
MTTVHVIAYADESWDEFADDADAEHDATFIAHHLAPVTPENLGLHRIGPWSPHFQSEQGGAVEAEFETVA